MGQAITIGGVPLGAGQMRCEFLGGLLACNDNNWPAIQTQLKKARSRWGSLSRILASQGRGHSKSFRNVLQGGGPGGVVVWFRILGVD